MIRIGEVNTLKVVSENKSGFLLEHPDDDEQVFLPGTLAPSGVAKDDELDLFITVDKEGSLIGSLEIPNTLVGEYGFLEVIDAQEFGAFLDWGVTKDLLVPDTEQRQRIRLGETHLIRVCMDERTEKIYGTTKINKYIQNTTFDIQEKDSVTIVPILNEELGYRCIINKKYIGMIYHNEIFKNIKIGRSYDGQVKKIRTDGLIDASLQVLGIKNVIDSKDTVVAYLQKCGGKSPLHDKSSPEEIKKALNISKKTFKNSIGMLFKDKTILIKKDGIELVKK